MKENRHNLRLSNEEKELLNKLAIQRRCSVTHYIKYRLFNSNPDISKDMDLYESPSGDKHNYLTAKTLQDIYLLILHLINANKTSEETVEIKKRCREHADKNIAKLGYLKVENNE